MERMVVRRSGQGRTHAPPTRLRVLAPLLGGLALACAIVPAASLAADPSPDASPRDRSAATTPTPASVGAPAPGLLGADVEVYREGFERAADWIDLGADETGETRLEDGVLYISVTGRDVNYRDWYELAAPVAVLRVEVLVDIDERDGTAAGVACGSALGLPRWFIAGVNNADEWFLGRQIEGRFQVVERGLLMLPISPSRDAVSVAIECAIAPDEGGDYVSVSVDGRPVSVETGLGRLDIPVGPYGRAGLYVATDRGTGSARFDDLVVHAGDALARAPTERDPTLPSE